MNITYELIKSQRKSFALQVSLDGNITVKAPLRASRKDIQQFVNKYQDWIETKLHNITAVTKQNYNKYYYLGNAYTLKLDKSATGIIFKESYLITSHMPEQIIAWYYEEARQLVQPFLKIYQQKFNLNPRLVKINSATKRWGSCSI